MSSNLPKESFVKKVILSALILVAGFSAQAKDTSPAGATCYVRDGAEFLGFTVDTLIEGRKFFSAVVNLSNRTNSCARGKIFGVAETNRVYINGRRVGDRDDGMTNAEADNVVRAYGYSLSECPTYSCIML